MKIQQGFTLIEALIAALILSVGLLGLAGLQITALKNNRTAYLRTQATQIAYDMVDRMRSNVIEAQKNANSTYITVLPINAVAQPDCDSVSSTCTSVDMAQNDLFQWKSVLDTLPSGTGSITGATVGTIYVYTLTVNWDDNGDGIVDTTNDANFQTRFQL